MKKVALLALCLFMSVPGIALAGKAYLPAFMVNPETTAPDGRTVSLRTDIHVANVSRVPQTVTVILFSADGAPLVNQPVVVHVGSAAGYTAYTDGNGEIATVIAGMTQVRLRMSAVSAQARGWGIIRGNTGDLGYGALVAHAVIFGALPDGTVYESAVPINGGSPF